MPGSVLLLTDARTDVHASPGHPERPARREAAASGVRDAGGDRLVEEVPEPAGDADITRIHDPDYLKLLDDAEARGGGWLDPDTYVVPGSMVAARLAAGATLHAARAVAAGDAEVAFAVMRPPGHHAGAMRGSGFCLLNNLAIAAAGLRADGLSRVAIVDWDVHHGDGTQAIFHGDPDLFYTSTHQYPFYPGTGPAEDDGGGIARNRPLGAGEGDDTFVAAWRDELLPAIESFGPDAILVSAGYDAHAADPLAELNVTDAGFEAVGRALGATAARLGIEGVMLTLEGGYDLDALRSSVAASVRGLLDGRAEA